jgi:hypothetical protein
MTAPRGNGLIRAAFAWADLDGLDDAVAALADRSSPVVAGLVAAVDVRHWQQTRAAVSALRRNRPPAVAAAPALAGWVLLCAEQASTPGRPDRPYALNEALGGLAELRAGLDGSWYLDVPAACRRVAVFLDEVFQPQLLEMLQRPMRIWHRGAFTYLRGHHGDASAVVTVVSRYLADVADDDDPPADRDWFAYTRADAVSLLGELDLASADRSAAPVVDGGVQVPVESLLHLAQHHPDAEVRAGALDGLAAARVDDERVLAIALRAADSDDAYERAAAVLLLAGLA